jgi:hypothetical protein
MPPQTGPKPRQDPSPAGLKYFLKTRKLNVILTGIPSAKKRRSILQKSILQKAIWEKITL